MQKSVIIVQAKQQRTDDLRRLRAIAIAADDALGSAHVLDLLHPRSLAGCVGHVDALGDDSIERAPGFLKPLARGCDISRRRRDPYLSLSFQVLRRESLEVWPTLAKRLLND